jgi:hypothetical protein
LVLALNDQWAGVADALKLYWKYSRDELADLVDRLYGANEAEVSLTEQADYERLVASANLIESIGVLRADGAITTQVVYRMWGGTIYAIWLSWEAALPKLRHHTGEPDILRGFEALSLAIADITKERAPGRRPPRGGATGAASASREKVEAGSEKNDSLTLQSDVPNGSASITRRLGGILVGAVFLSAAADLLRRRK